MSNFEVPSCSQHGTEANPWCLECHVLAGTVPVGYRAPARSVTKRRPNKAWATFGTLLTTMLVIASVLVGTSLHTVFWPPTFAPIAAGPGVPQPPVNEEICGSSVLQSPWSGSGVPSGDMTGGNITQETSSGEWAGLPTWGTSGTTFPNITTAYVVGSGTANPSEYIQSQPADSLFMFAPGTYLGAESQPWNGDVFLGLYNSTSGEATYQSNQVQDLIFSVGNSAHSGAIPTDVTIEYLTIDDATNEAIDDYGTANSWVIQYNTITNNSASSGGQPEGEGISGEGTIVSNCISDNGVAGVNLFNSEVTTSLSSALSTSGAITSLPVNTVTLGVFSDIPSGSTITVSSSLGWQEFTTSSDYTTGSTIAVTSETPLYAFPGASGGVPSGAAIVSWGGVLYDEFQGNGNASGPGTSISTPDPAGTSANVKGWVTSNSVVAFTYSAYSLSGIPIWFDTSNTGFLIADNFIEYSTYRDMQIEISYDGDIWGNTFLYDGIWGGAQLGLTGIDNSPGGIEINLGGGIAVTGSLYSSASTGCPAGYTSGCLLIEDNTFYDDWYGIQEYGESDRSCINPQPNNDYCTGTDLSSFDNYSGPSAGGESDIPGGPSLTAACNGATTPCATLSVNYHYALGDKIGFASGSFPYTVTSISGTNTSGSLLGRLGTYTIGVSPSVAVNEASAASIYGEGTCPLYDTSGATPTTPTPSSEGFGSQTISYYDGCQWKTDNNVVSGNTFHFLATDIQAVTPPYVALGWTYTASRCYSGSNYVDPVDAPPTGNSYLCGFNQVFGGGGNNGPYTTTVIQNAIMSNAAFTAPLSNLNSASYGGNGEAPDNNLWSGNSYTGNIAWSSYQQTNTYGAGYECGSTIDSFQPYCSVPATGSPSWATTWQQG